jgi:uncharacterized membrane protein
MNIFIKYISTIVPLIVLDGVWIMIIAKSFYAEKMGFLFSKSINMTPVLFFYPIYSLAILLLAILPAVKSNSWQEALWRGAILGIAAYGAYDLTNHATIKGWPLSMTLLDMFWGTLVTALVSLIAYSIITKFS